MNCSTLDMATASKILKTFSGEDNEDVSSWIRDALLIARIGRMSEEETVRTMILSLRGKALSWISIILQHQSDISLSTLTSQLSTRFKNQRVSDEKMTRFLNRKMSTTPLEYREVLQEATDIFENGGMNIEALI